MVRCSCPSGSRLRGDNRTCVRIESVNYCNALFDARQCLSGLFWACSISRQVLSIDQVCDGYPDCPAREDEEHCRGWINSNGDQIKLPVLYDF